MRGFYAYKNLVRYWISIPPTNASALKAEAYVHAEFESDCRTAPPMNTKMNFQRYAEQPTNTSKNNAHLSKSCSCHAALDVRQKSDDANCRDPKNPQGPNYQPQMRTESKASIEKVSVGHDALQLKQSLPNLKRINNRVPITRTLNTSTGSDKPTTVRNSAF